MWGRRKEKTAALPADAGPGAAAGSLPETREAQERADNGAGGWSEHPAAARMGSHLQPSIQGAPMSTHETASAAQTETPAAPNGGAAQQEGLAASSSVFTEPMPGPKRRTVSEVLGEIVWLFSQSAHHKTFFISDLEWLVMTPIVLQQFRIFYAPDRPIGVALWAKAAPHVAQRLAAGNGRLSPQDWKSGDELWLVDIVAPFGGKDEMLKDLKLNVFPQETIKFAAVKDGKHVVASL